jgi:hypothetical protein
MGDIPRVIYMSNLYLMFPGSSRSAVRPTRSSVVQDTYLRVAFVVSHPPL